jgi:hypothetical protein
LNKVTYHDVQAHLQTDPVEAQTHLLEFAYAEEREDLVKLFTVQTLNEEVYTTQVVKEATLEGK